MHLKNISTIASSLTLTLGLTLSSAAQTGAPATSPQAQPRSSAQGPLTTATSPSVTPPAHPATAEQIKEYLAITSAAENAHKMITQNVATSRANAPSYVPNTFWDDLSKSMGSIDLVTALIPVYQKYFSQEDMAAALVFYKTPAGKHILDDQPLVSANAGEILRTEVNRVGQETYQRHKTEIDAATKAHQPQAPSLGAPTDKSPTAPSTAPAPQK